MNVPLAGYIALAIFISGLILLIYFSAQLLIDTLRRGRR